jgi:hypothetical protein
MVAQSLFWGRRDKFFASCDTAMKHFSTLTAPFCRFDANIRRPPSAGDPGNDVLNERDPTGDGRCSTWAHSSRIPALPPSELIIHPHGERRSLGRALALSGAPSRTSSFERREGASSG